MLSRWYLCVFQGYANGHGTISQTLIKHTDRVNCVKWISNSNSKYNHLENL